MSDPDAAAFSNPLPRYKFWEKRVIAAYLRMLGHSQKAVAAAVNRNVRTIRNWENETATWTQARDEAAARWLSDLVDAARGTVLTAVQGGDAALALSILERRLPELAPPKSRVELSIPWDHLTDDQLRRIASGEPPAKVLSYVNAGLHPSGGAAPLA
jgi:sulfur carrier protein ThiS